MKNLKEKEQQFLEAYEKYADAIYRHCFFRVFRKSRAEELVQEVFMRTWEYILEDKQIENFKAFLYRVANNLIIDESRKKKEESLDQLLEESSSSEPSHEGHKEMERRVIMREVIGKIQKLPLEEREILIMRYVDDLDLEEIAEILDITTNNVSVRIHRATRLLKDNFHQSNG